MARPLLLNRQSRATEALQWACVVSFFIALALVFGSFETTSAELREALNEQGHDVVSVTRMGSTDDPEFSAGVPTVCGQDRTGWIANLGDGNWLTVCTGETWAGLGRPKIEIL